MKIKINPLRSGAWLFFAIIIVYTLFLKFTPSNYSLSIKDAAIDTTFSMASMFDFKNDITTNKNDIMIVDVSPLLIFQKGHIEKSINIPAEEILNSTHLKSFEERKVYIYSDNEAKSYKIAFLLFQMGIDANPIAGNYKLINNYLKDSQYASYAFFSDEKPKFNYAKFFKGNGAIVNKSSESKAEVKKVIVGKGGC